MCFRAPRARLAQAARVLTIQQEHQPHHLGRLTVFAGVRDLPTRVKCAILPWHTLHAALNAQESTTTEADADPMHTPLGNA